MSAKALLIYDGECPMCLRARDWLARRIPADRIDFLACQDPARPTRAPGVSESDCLSAMQLVLPDGRVLAGADAFPPLLRLVRGGRWLAWIFALPGARMAYRLVARNRHTLSAFFKTPGERCSVDRGCDRPDR